MPRKTDSKNPADWLLIVESELELLRQGVTHEWSFAMCRSKLAEVLDKNHQGGTHPARVAVGEDA